MVWIYAAVVVLLWAHVATACLFTWSAPPLRTDGTFINWGRYRLYESLTPTAHTFGTDWAGDTTKTSLVVPCRADAYWVVVVVDASGRESAPSNVVFVDVTPPSPPARLRVVPASP